MHVFFSLAKANPLAETDSFCLRAIENYWEQTIILFFWLWTVRIAWCFHFSRTTGLFMFILHLCSVCSESFSRSSRGRCGFSEWDVDATSSMRLCRSGARAACMVRVIDSTGGHLEEIRVIACHGLFNTLMSWAISILTTND